MNEEEIIERIKDLIRTCNVGIQEHGEYDDLFELDKTALEGILELYKVQKRQLNDAFNRGWIHKDKIREKIEDIDNYAIFTDNIELNWQLKIEDTAKIEVLKELLEEEDGTKRENISSKMDK